MPLYFISRFEITRTRLIRCYNPVLAGMPSNTGLLRFLAEVRALTHLLRAVPRTRRKTSRRRMATLLDW